jgi:toxin YoeB
MYINFEQEAFDDYNAWEEEDKKLYEKIKALIKDIKRTPFKGLGKPEPLKYRWSGYWSRRITDEHRLIYKVEKETIYIASCKYHYNDK